MKTKQPKVKRHNEVWDDTYYVRIYEAVREGLTKAEVSRLLGISHKTLNTWIRDRPALQDAVEKARTKLPDRKKGGETFFEYVYRQLPAELKEYWDNLCLADKEKTCTPDYIESLIGDKGKTTRQKLFVHALMSSNFNPSEACRKVNISKSTLETWVKYDPGFGAMMEEVQWHKKNFFEGGLIGLVAQGDSAATIFANKTVNRDRGYNDKQEISVTKTNVLDLSQLQLAPEILRAVLEAVRKKEMEALPARQGEILEVENAD